MINEIKPFEERKNEIIKKAKEVGFITYEMLANELKGLDLESEQLDELYDAFVKEGIEIVSEEDDAGDDDADGGDFDIPAFLRDRNY